MRYKLYSLLVVVGLLFAGSVFALPLIQYFNTDVQFKKGVIDSYGSTGTPGQLWSSTGTSTKWVSTSTVFAEVDPIWTSFLTNPIFTNLTSTNFFASNTLFLNATTTNLGVNNIFSYGVPTFVIKTDAGDNTGNMEIRLGLYENGELNLFGGLYLNNGVSSPNPSGRASLVTIPLTASREITFQDKDGVFAYTNDNISEFTNDIGYITNAEETDPIWTAFLTDPIFTSLTSTNFYSNNIMFVNATGTSITSTNGYFNSIYSNTTTQLGTLTLQGVSTLDPVSVRSSTGRQMFAVKKNGQVVVGANSLSQTGAMAVETQTGNDIALSFTDGLSYTAFLGKQPGTSGQMAFGGPSGTSLNLWAGGVSRMILVQPSGFVGINSSSPLAQFAVKGSSASPLVNFTSSTNASNLIILANGNVGINSSTPSTQFVVEGATTLNGQLQFTLANGTSLTSTNAVFTNATSTNLYVSSKVKINTTTNTYALNVGGYTGSDRYYTANPNSYIQADGTTGITIAGGNTTINTGYLYAATAGTSFYAQGASVFRGAISNDTGSALTINGGTGKITNLTTKVGINTSSPLAMLSVVSSTASATATMSVGGTGIGKYCLWNGASWTITSFPSNSITPTIVTSTICN